MLYNIVTEKNEEELRLKIEAYFIHYFSLKNGNQNILNFIIEIIQSKKEEIKAQY